MFRKLSASAELARDRVGVTVGLKVKVKARVSYRVKVRVRKVNFVDVDC